MGRFCGVAQAWGSKRVDRGSARRKEEDRDHLDAGAGCRDRFVRTSGEAGYLRDHGVSRYLAGIQSAAAVAQDRIARPALVPDSLRLDKIKSGMRRLISHP